MLNIRRRLSIMAVVAIVAGHCTPAFALEAPTVEITQGEDAKNPLELYALKKKLTDDELVDLLQRVGFKGKSLNVAYAVAKKESNGRPTAHNNNANTGDNSYGIFQINMLGELGKQRREKYGLSSNRDLFNPVTNAKIAYHMSNRGKIWTAWKVTPGKNNGPRFAMFYKSILTDVCLVPLTPRKSENRKDNLI